MGKKKRRKKWKAISEFRHVNSASSEGHKKYLFKKKGRTYKGLGLTHSSKTKGKNNIRLNKNPDPRDKRPSYIRPEIEEVSFYDLSPIKPSMFFIESDKKIVNDLIKRLEEEKK